jgi:hypothetical protein
MHERAIRQLHECLNTRRRETTVAHAAHSPSVHDDGPAAAADLAGQERGSSLLTLQRCKLQRNGLRPPRVVRVLSRTLDEIRELRHGRPGRKESRSREGISVRECSRDEIDNALDDGRSRLWPATPAATKRRFNIACKRAAQESLGSAASTPHMSWQAAAISFGALQVLQVLDEHSDGFAMPTQGPQQKHALLMEARGGG